MGLGLYFKAVEVYNMAIQDTVKELQERFEGKSADEVLDYFLKAYKGKIALSSSLSYEDQVLTDLIVKKDPATRIFTLDTGRLFPETYKLIDKTQMQYGIELEVFFPDFNNIQKMVREKGINLFYNSEEDRHLCCQLRKLEPLHRAFQGLEVWICGLRRSQSVTRTAMKVVEWDAKNGLIKVNPLIDWSEEQTKQYVHDNHVPYNPLHDKGFPSIGCEPCTRAVKPGEDIRSGRWWWEDPTHRECGLHK